MRDADWSRETLLRSDWLIPIVAPITTALNLKMTIAQVVETSVTVKDSLQDCSHLDNHAPPS